MNLSEHTFEFIKYSILNYLSDPISKRFFINKEDFEEFINNFKIEEIQNSLKLSKKEKYNFLKNDDDFWNKFTESNNFEDLEKKIKYILTEYGTKLSSNRFSVGISIEILLAKDMRERGFEIEELSNNKRIDLCINKMYNISVKYSKTGDIKIHNSLGINKDMNFPNLLLLTSTDLYLITCNTLKTHNINIKNYLKNTGDGLKLKRKLLLELKSKGYKYRLSLDLLISDCKNKSCVEVFVNKVMLDYNNLKKID